MTEPGPGLDETIAVLREKLPTALGTTAMPGTEGWTLRSIRNDRFFGHTVISLVLGNDDGSFQGHLFPANALEVPYYRDDHFDFVYIDDAHESRGKAHREVIDQFVRWLGITFQARARRLAPVPPAAVAPPPVRPEPTHEERALARTIDEALSSALTAGELPALAGWNVAAVALEPYREHFAPTVRLSRDGRTLGMYLLPLGSDRSAFFRTKRFEVLYDDAQGNTLARDRTVIEGFVAWLGQRFPAERKVPRVNADVGDSTMALKAQCLAIETELSRALRDGALLPALERWSLDGVALGTFRNHEAPSLKLTHEGHTLVLYLLPAGTDADAFFRTKRYDVLYDDAQSSTYSRDRDVIEALVVWLAATFPADDEL